MTDLPDQPLSVAAAVRYYRVQRGYTARALSLNAGLSQSYVGKLEAGKVIPSVRAFGRLARVLGMNHREVALVVLQEGNESS